MMLTRTFVLVGVMCAAVVAGAVGVPDSVPVGLDLQDPQDPIYKTSIIGKGGRAPSIAVPDFGVVAATPELQQAGQTLAEVLWSDLEFEREYYLIERKESAKIPASDSVETLPYERWAELGADGVVIASVQAADKGGIQVTVRLVSVGGQKAVFGKTYSGCTVKGVRQCAHTIADEIHKDQRGLDGVARTKIAFTSDRDGERLPVSFQDRTVKEIYVSDYDGFGQTPVTADRSINLAPNWSPDGRYLAYMSFASRFQDIYFKDMRQFGPPVRPAKGTDLIQNSLPSWSPDGRRLVFVSNRSGNQDIYVINRDGSGLTQITVHPKVDTSPTWSPSGEQIAFVSDRSGSPQIYVMSATGGQAERVTDSEQHADRPRWSPPPFNYIAYAAKTSEAGFDIRVIDFRTRQVRTLTDGSGTNESPAIAPNGRHIAFYTTRWGKQQIAVIGYDGKGMRRVTTAGNNTYPHWSPIPGGR